MTEVPNTLAIHNCNFRNNFYAKSVVVLCPMPPINNVQNLIKLQQVYECQL